MEVRRRNLVSEGSQNTGSSTTSGSDTESRSLLAVDHPQASVHLWDWVVVFGLILFLVVFIPLHSTSCGDFVPSGTDPNSTFQELFARKHLQYVTRLGPRTGGSINNEIHARKYLLSEIQKVVELAQSSGLVADLDEQIARPSSFKTHVHITSYANIPNLLLRLRDPRVKGDSAARSVLVNCHYDTAPQSPGASDAFVGCANSLEVARILAGGGTTLRNNIIFLFNSAEENILPASHAFITQHPWAEEVAVFINLEGAGAGGKLLVFQSGPGPASSALIQFYSSTARYPFASVVGEEVFHFGFIPSDTDFRIFRDYGLIPGLDLAYIGNGYAYHTCHDIEERISPSCLHLAGDNLLQLVKLMAQDPSVNRMKKLERSNEPKVENEIIFSPEGGLGNIHAFSNAQVESNFARYVYFDVLGYFILSYPWFVGRMIHWSVFIVILLWIFLSQKSGGGSHSGLFLATLIQTLFFITGHLFSLLVGYVIHMYGCRMSWYTNKCNLFGLYLLPLLSYFLFYHSVLLKIPSGSLWHLPGLRYLLQRSLWFDTTSIKTLVIENDFFKGSVLVMSIMTLIALCYNSPASYVPLFWCLLATVFRFIYFMMFGRTGVCYVAKVLLVLLPPLVIFHISSVYTLFEVFIPIMGRSGHEAQPDVIIGGLVAFSSVPVLMFCADSVHLTSSETSRVLRRITINGCISFIIIVHTSFLGFPYTVMPDNNRHLVPPSQQRVAVFHTNRWFSESPLNSTVTREDSGLFIFPLDANRFRYYHHPPSPAPNPFMLRFQQYLSSEPSETFYFPEIEQMEPFTFHHTVPYCGVPVLYPLLNAFDTIYYIPAPKHNSPSTGFAITERHQEASSDGVQLVNLTVSIDSSAPLTQLYLRTAPDYVRLTRWSFAPEQACPQPVPIPRGTSHQTDADGPRSAHFYINHIDPSVATSRTGQWAQPWVFWLQFSVYPVSLNPDLSDSNVGVDIAVVSQYMDESVPQGVSDPMRRILHRLPQWAVASHWLSSYNHTRLLLLS
ncbi:Endoplasmic reticulum metallopeptidase 1 [Echinococcus granulosus]|uniref:Endoplasmic reticulum metallopeptidase n=1 Tax=Echinococcus granulosus TaxID=6210 RepID=U6IZM6_ECHGR|nr:Endoplasmic reticulum metallopeptidase [Echinococcus granulosus]EUB64650.1 Endoplasmic reticulum metallopeptidase [Echinococcus granulosus]KAH9286566.1 Endoplasmic reticulum metallopeptidase 1 [Echinococcus granulosus]CDS16481.1 endoplasmic reticulum metallopeptidase 1 [Echinococcus granulosus]